MFCLACNLRHITNHSRVILYVVRPKKDNIVYDFIIVVWINSFKQNLSMITKLKQAFETLFKSLHLFRCYLV